MFINLRIAGHLDPRWSDWFEGFVMCYLADGSTEISGAVADQAALYGFLNRAQDLGLTLLAVSIEPERAQDETSEGTGNEADETALR